VKSGGHVVWVKLEEIDWIGSADNYAELHWARNRNLLRETLARSKPGSRRKNSSVSALGHRQRRSASRNFTGCFTAAVNWCSTTARA